MDGQNLAGQLTDWSVDDLLQIMQVTKKTGSLDITGDRSGRVHFRDGSVTGAELGGMPSNEVSTDPASVAEILFVLSSMNNGSFAVGDPDGPDGEGLVPEDIIKEVELLRSLEDELGNTGLLEAKGVTLARTLKKPININPEDWIRLVSLVDSFTFEDVEATQGRGAAVRLFDALHRLAVAEILEEPDESEWLGEVADSVASEEAEASESNEPTWLESQGEAPKAKHVAEPVEDSVDEETDEAPVVEEPEAPVDEPVAADEEEADETADGDDRELAGAVSGIAAPASTTLTDSVYDEIRRLRNQVSK